MAGDNKVMVVVELDGQDAALVSAWLADYGRSEHASHGNLTTPAALAKMLLEDVALAMRRPGSWEGSNMWTVLSSHGYGNC